MEKAVELNWVDIWIETDSVMVVKAFTKQIEVPWRLHVRWLNYLASISNFSCNCSHIHREGNSVADALARNGHSLPSLHSQWWQHPPLFILPLLYRDSIGLPYLRHSNM
jgi:ribonuclease HI